MRRNALLPVSIGLPGMLLLVGTGCGIITAPVSVPDAIAANHDAHLEGTITDPAGDPLTDVTLTVQKEHTYWDPVLSDRVEYEDSSTLVSGTFSISRRGSSRVRLTFAKPGYVPALVEFDEHSLYLAAAATTQPGAADAGNVPDTRPGPYRSGVMFGGPVMPENRNAMHLDPSWHPSQPVRIILYPGKRK